MKKKQLPAAESWQALADKLGFDRETAPVLVQALTHPAYYEGNRSHHAGDNQRLEFLGDAVLDLLIGEYLYRHYPEAQEGILSKMRAYIVCEASLAEAAVALGVDRALRLLHLLRAVSGRTLKAAFIAANFCSAADKAAAKRKASWLRPQLRLPRRKAGSARSNSRAGTQIRPRSRSAGSYDKTSPGKERIQL